MQSNSQMSFQVEKFQKDANKCIMPLRAVEQVEDFTSTLYAPFATNTSNLAGSSNRNWPSTSFGTMTAAPTLQLVNCLPMVQSTDKIHEV